MSLIITLSSAMLATAVLYSAFSKFKKYISESLVYKDTPTLINMNNKCKEDYIIAKSKNCYGDMGRLVNKIDEIRKEMEKRMINTKVGISILDK